MYCSRISINGMGYVYTRDDVPAASSAISGPLTNIVEEMQMKKKLWKNGKSQGRLRPGVRDLPRSEEVSLILKNLWKWLWAFWRPSTVKPGLLTWTWSIPYLASYVFSLFPFNSQIGANSAIFDREWAAVPVPDEHGDVELPLIGIEKGITQAAARGEWH